MENEGSSSSIVLAAVLLLTLLIIGIVLYAYFSSPQSDTENRDGNDTTINNEIDQTPQNDQPVNRNEDSLGTVSGFDYGEATVESFDVTKQSETSATVSVTGYTSDSCTEIDQVNQSYQGRTVKISITTRRPKDTACTQVIQNFNRDIPVDITGLDGEYVFDVNGKTKTVSL